ncbi:MAG: methionine--tRNA ligase subunit beta [Candidatus Daviesbacteria bacterium]
MTNISFEDFSKIELRVGTVLEAEEVVDSEKLIKMKVDLGEEEPRQILAGIKAWYTPSKLVEKQFIFVANLEPKTMMGLESQGMILAADQNGKAILLKPSSKVPPGTKVR